MAVSRVGSWTTTVDSDPTGTVTVGSGSNRAFVLELVAERDGLLTVSTMTIGGISSTAKYEEYVDDSTSDHILYTYLWNESAIASMTGSTISYVDGVVLNKRGFSYATYQSVDQVTFPKLQNVTSSTTDAQPSAVTTTSLASDYIVALGYTDSGSRTFSTWDTLSEVWDAQDSGANLRMGAADGAGGAATTTVVLSGASSHTIMCIVLGAATGLSDGIGRGIMRGVGRGIG